MEKRIGVIGGPELGCSILGKTIGEIEKPKSVICVIPPNFDEGKLSEIKQEYGDEIKFITIEEAEILLSENKICESDLAVIDDNKVVDLELIHQLRQQQISKPFEIRNHRLSDFEMNDMMYGGATKKQLNQIVVPVTPKSLISRNDKCSCGSGKKFKQCCLNKK